MSRIEEEWAKEQKKSKPSLFSAFFRANKSCLPRVFIFSLFGFGLKTFMPFVLSGFGPVSTGWGPIPGHVILNHCENSSTGSLSRVQTPHPQTWATHICLPGFMAYVLLLRHGLLHRLCTGIWPTGIIFAPRKLVSNLEFRENLRSFENHVKSYAHFYTKNAWIWMLKEGEVSQLVKSSISCRSMWIVVIEYYCLSHKYQFPQYCWQLQFGRFMLEWEMRFGVHWERQSSFCCSISAKAKSLGRTELLLQRKQERIL